MICKIEPFTGEWNMLEEAHAHLIAAAPKLREVLSAFVGNFEATHRGRSINGVPLLIENARKIIKKSEGG